MKNYFVALILLLGCKLNSQNTIRVGYLAEHKIDVILGRAEKLKQEKPNSLIDVNYFEKLYREEQENLNNSEIILLADGEAYKLTYVSPMPSDRYLISSYNAAVGFFDAQLIYGDIKNETIYLAGTKGNVEIDRVFNLNEVAWELTNETETILGYTCYKAIGHLREEKNGNSKLFPITAWFAPDLPYKGGPTQYVSLPGLILKYETQISIVKAVSIDSGSFKITPYTPQFKVMTYAKFIQHRDSIDRIYRPREH